MGIEVLHANRVGGRGSCGSLFNNLSSSDLWLVSEGVGPELNTTTQVAVQEVPQICFSHTCSKPLVHFVPTSTRRDAAPPSIYDRVSMHVGLSVGCYPKFDVSD